MALDVILQLDVAQESRALSQDECWLRANLKRRVKGLAALERSRKRQASRLRFLREGDANTKFFHQRVNARRRKNHIVRLKHNNGRPPPRSLYFNWDALNPNTHPLDDLGPPFSEDEIKEALDDMPADKSPGPDGFSIAFFRSYWDIIKEDLMSAIKAFSELSTSNFHIINTANVVLLPKKDGADAISDYRPISLIHVVPKIIAKAMARRLSPRMNDLVSRSQSAFIKSRTIHDNFMYVRNTARRLHRNKTPSLLIKLDIAKAFDTVSWTYILDMLEARGFPLRYF
jgi:hypothetical protein